MALLVDLGAEALQDPVRLGFVGGRRRQAQLFASERVDTRVHEHLVRVAALADVPALAAVADRLGHPGDATR
jgi:hypothetical protein